MRIFFIVFFIASLVGCSPTPEKNLPETFDKVVLVSLDSTVTSEVEEPDSSICLSKNRDFQVVDLTGHPLYTKTVSVTLEGPEKEFVIDFFSNLRPDSISIADVPSVGTAFRDAVLFYNKNQAEPKKVYILNLTKNDIYSNSVKSPNDYVYFYPDLEKLADLFVKKRLKSSEVENNWR